MAATALLIGQSASLERLELQLDLLKTRPGSLGWLLPPGDDPPADYRTVLGTTEDLERIVTDMKPDLALICLPAVCRDLIATLRTRLRRLGVPDRFIPTLEDQIDGVGPRMELDLDYAELLGRPHRREDDEAICRVVGGRRVLVTGAGGSIGSELSRIVAAHGPTALILMDRAENALFDIDRQIARRAPGLDRTSVLHDVVDAPGTLRHCLTLKPDLIFHAAAHKHVPMSEDHPGSAVDNNFFGTIAVADAADAAGVERFVMISTDKAVKPTSIMGATKRLAELYVQSIAPRSTTRYSMVRFGNVLGSSGSVLETWARQLADGGPITVTDAQMTRYFMTIPEAAGLVIASAGLIDDTARDAEVFLLDMGEPVRIIDLAQSFIRVHGLQPLLPTETTQRAPSGTLPIICTGIRPGEKLHEELTFDSDQMRETTHADINAWLVSRHDQATIDAAVIQLAADQRPRDPAAIARLLRSFVPDMTAGPTDAESSQSIEIKDVRSQAREAASGVDVAGSTCVGEDTPTVTRGSGDDQEGP